MLFRSWWMRTLAFIAVTIAWLAATVALGLWAKVTVLLFMAGWNAIP